MDYVSFSLSILLSIVIRLFSTMIRPNVVKYDTEAARLNKHAVSNHSNKSQPVRVHSEEKRLYGKLLGMLLGDKAVAERLLADKRKKFPIDSREQIIEKVIEQLAWERMRN